MMSKKEVLTVFSIQRAPLSGPTPSSQIRCLHPEIFRKLHRSPSQTLLPWIKPQSRKIARQSLFKDLSVASAIISSGQGCLKAQSYSICPDVCPNIRWSPGELR